MLELEYLHHNIVYKAVINIQYNYNHFKGNHVCDTVLNNHYECVSCQKIDVISHVCDAELVCARIDENMAIFQHQLCITT